MGRKPLSPIEKSKLEEERAYERLAAMLRREGLYVSPLQQDEGVADFVVDATATSCQGPHSVQGFKEYASNSHRLGLVVEFKSSGAKNRPNFFAANHQNDQHFSSSVAAHGVDLFIFFRYSHRRTEYQVYLVRPWHPILDQPHIRTLNKFVNAGIEAITDEASLGSALRREYQFKHGVCSL